MKINRNRTRRLILYCHSLNFLSSGKLKIPILLTVTSKNSAKTQ